MATLQLEERVIDAAIAKLKAGIASRIAAINAEFADTVTVGTPSTDSYYVGGTDAIPSGRTPAIIITDGGSGEAGGFTEEGPHSLTCELSLIVFIVDEDGIREHLARKLLRLERAVMETLWDDDPKEAVQITTPTPNLAYVRPARVQPGPVFNPENDESLYRQWRALVFAVTKYEL